MLVRRRRRVRLVLRLRGRLVLRRWLQRGLWLQWGLLGLRLGLVRRGEWGVQGPLPCQKKEKQFYKRMYRSCSRLAVSVKTTPSRRTR